MGLWGCVGLWMCVGVGLSGSEGLWFVNVWERRGEAEGTNSGVTTVQEKISLNWPYFLVLFFSLVFKGNPVFTPLLGGGLTQPIP